MPRDAAFSTYQLVHVLFKACMGSSDDRELAQGLLRAVLAAPADWRLFGRTCT